MNDLTKRSVLTSDSDGGAGDDANLDLHSHGARVEIEGVTKVFQAPDRQEFVALEKVDLTFRPTEFVAIVGASGCGKTTLLRMLKGLDRPSTGEIRVTTSSGQPARAALVFQRPSLIPWRSVYGNIRFGLDARSARRLYADRRAEDERIDSLLKLTGLENFRNHWPRQLSGGMQQRVNLARALALDPGLLLMDEPFSALDALTRERLQRELRQIVGRLNATVVFVTHDIREAVFLADFVVVMASGPGRVIHQMRIKAPAERDPDFQQGPELAEQAKEIWELLQAADASGRLTA